MPEARKFLLAYFYVGADGSEGRGKAYGNLLAGQLLTEQRIVSWEREIKAVNSFRQVGITHTSPLEG